MRSSTRGFTGFTGLALAAAALLGTPDATAYPLRRGLGGPAGFGADSLAANDDLSTGEIDLRAAFPMGLRFFSQTFATLWVNNNGNVTFSGAVAQYTPGAFPIASRPMIAPWWGDVDTRGGGFPNTNGVFWSIEPGRFTATWHNVGYFSSHDNLLNDFQLILTDRSDTGPGDFDVEFRYERCEWTTGDASGGVGGFGGTPAQAGFDAGNLRDFTALPGSLTRDILRVCDTSNVGAAGLWQFQIRAGVVLTDAGMPLPPPYDAGPLCQGGCDPAMRLTGRAGPLGWLLVLGDTRRSAAGIAHGDARRVCAAHSVRVRAPPSHDARVAHDGLSAALRVHRRALVSPFDSATVPGAMDPAAAYLLAAIRDGRQRFVSRHPKGFLVRRPDAAPDPATPIIEAPTEDVTTNYKTSLFSTARVERAPNRIAPLSLATWIIAAIEKREGNPYPERISVGRARNCDVSLRHHSISKLHAHLLIEDGQVVSVVDQRSTNGTGVGHRTVPSGVPVPIVWGDEVIFGSVNVLFVSAAAAFEIITES